MIKRYRVTYICGSDAMPGETTIECDNFGTIGDVALRALWPPASCPLIITKIELLPETKPEPKVLYKARVNAKEGELLTGGYSVNESSQFDELNDAIDWLHAIAVDNENSDKVKSVQIFERRPGLTSWLVYSNCINGCSTTPCMHSGDGSEPWDLDR